MKLDGMLLGVQRHQPCHFSRITSSQANSEIKKSQVPSVQWFSFVPQAKV